MLSCRAIYYGMFCWWLISTAGTVAAQNVPLTNASLEGTPGKNHIPAGWQVVTGTPDIQPGVFGIQLPAAAGNSYAGMHGGYRFMEGIGQELVAPLVPGTTYVMSLDLATAPAYLYPVCYGNVAVFGGMTPGDTAQLLWMSGAFTHTGWQRYHAAFMPHAAYRYISFWCYPLVNCNKSEYGVAALLDNIAGIDVLMPLHVQATVKPCSCGGLSDGELAVHTSGGIPPYQYRIDNGNWQPDSVFRELAAGPHIYEVTDRHGYTASGKADVESPWPNCLVVFPNAFSPDNNGQNDIFRPRIYDAIYNYQLTVYDRWGSKVFSSRDPATGWDGRVNGHMAGMQSFVYVCTYVDGRHQSRMLKGTVLLLR